MRGDRNDRNGPYLASSLLRLGIDPARITVVGDEPADLQAALAEGLSYDLLCISGGLGPTHDDRTIELLAAAAGVGLHVEAALRDGIEELSRRVAKRLGRPYTDFADGVTKQATLPDGALWVGLVGTAPAVVLEAGGCVAVALPGPPRELQELWPRVLETEPLRRLLERAQPPARSVLRFYGVSESAVAQSLAAAGGDGDGVDVTICARDFELHVDLFAHPGAEQRAQAIADALVADSEPYLFSREEVGTAELVLGLLRERGLSLATAESCTGGLVAGRLTDVPGSSDVFRGAIVAYDNEIKQGLLGVDAVAARRARRGLGRGRRRDGARCTRAARRRRRRLGDGRRRAWGRERGEAGRACLPARVGADGRARPALQLPGRPRDDSQPLRGRGAAPRAATRHRVVTDTSHGGR